MANKSYVRYSVGLKYESQSIYLRSGSSHSVMEELKSLGARRILLICTRSVRKYRNVNDLTKYLEDGGLRVFHFEKSEGALVERDTVRALDVYLEFNCDTIITVGGSYEIDCGKLVSAMATNEVRSPRDFVGLNKLRRDMSVLCCMVIDNSTAVSMSSAEFLDDEHVWQVALSAYLIPQIVVVDTDIAMRTKVSVVSSRAVISLCTAIESALCTYKRMPGEYRADAINACMQLFKFIPLMMEDPDDSHYRRQVAAAGIYAGTAQRIVGLGPAHLILHEYISIHGISSEAVYVDAVCAMIENSPPEMSALIAELVGVLGFTDKSADEAESARILISELRRIAALIRSEEVPPLSSDDAVRIALNISRRAPLLGFAPDDGRIIERMLRTMCSNG